jgi:hypothetical protein
MRIIHARTYLRSTKKLFSSDDLLRVDRIVSAEPTIGDIIPGTNGVRKVRLAFDGRGKRGGVRVIYYHWQAGGELHLIYAYAKNQKKDLTPEEKKAASYLVLMIQRGEYEN